MTSKNQSKETIEKRKAKMKAALINVLKEMPIIEVAVKRVGISRDSYYRWRKEDKDFLKNSDEAIIQGVEFINDMSESQVVSLIKERNLSAIGLWLRHNHPKYKQRIEISTRVLPQEELNPEQEITVREALRLSYMPELEARIDESYLDDERDRTVRSGDQLERVPEEKVYKSVADITEPITKPITIKEAGKETTYYPNKEKIVKLADGAICYSPPDNGYPRLEPNHQLPAKPINPLTK
jgi:hypothetical protein